MFRLLDRYILKKFAVTLTVSLLSMILVYIVIDLFDHLNKFLDAEMPLIGFVVYYTLKIPEIIYQLFPVVVFMALLFTLGNLTKYKEITAMMSSGISLLRISAPVIFIGIVLSVSHFFFGETIVPYAARKHYEVRDYYMGKKSKFHRRKNEFVYQEQNSVVYINTFDGRSGIANGISIQAISEGSINFRIDADKMTFGDGKWKLRDAVRRTFTSDSTFYQSFDSLTVFLDFEPDDILEIELKPVEMGYFELKEYIAKRKSFGTDMTKWEVEKMSKVSYSAITLVLILIAIPLSTGRARSAASVNFGISVGMAFIYYLLIIMFKNWGAVGQLNVTVASWGPNLIFGLFGIYLIKRAK